MAIPVKLAGTGSSPRMNLRAAACMASTGAMAAAGYASRTGQAPGSGHIGLRRLVLKAAGKRRAR